MGVKETAEQKTVEFIQHPFHPVLLYWLFLCVWPLNNIYIHHVFNKNHVQMDHCCYVCAPHAVWPLVCLVSSCFCLLGGTVLSETLVVDSEELLPPDPFSPTIFIHSLAACGIRRARTGFISSYMADHNETKKPIQRMSADVLEGNICAVFQWRGCSIRRLHLKADYFTAVWQKLSFQRLKLFFPIWWRLSRKREIRIMWRDLGNF